MMPSKILKRLILVTLISNFGICRSDELAREEESVVAQPSAALQKVQGEDFDGLVIKRIIIKRHNPNNFLTEAMIRSNIPYIAGEQFSVAKTSKLIHKLYDLGQPFSYFEQVLVAGEVLDQASMNLYVITYEKPLLVEAEFNGRKAVSEKDLSKALALDDVHALAEIDLPQVEQKIRKLYRENDYHFAQIKAELKPVKSSNKLFPQVKLVVNIKEDQPARVRRVLFKGNRQVQDRHLRKIMFTREDWLLGPLTKAGSYHPENLVADKHFIRNHYKSNGYLLANVIDVQTDLNPETKQFDLTFIIDEGDQYRVGEVQIEGGTSDVSNEFLLSVLPLQPGAIYSEKDLRDASELLRTVWGEQGYVFVETAPMVVPDPATKTVAITFSIELGSKVHLNRLNVYGNKKTRDKVIRRKLALAEGDLMTTVRMDVSKDRILQLGYFDPQGGVEWKMHKLDDDWADLDLILKEKKTGRAGMNMGYGGGPGQMATSNSIRVGAEVYDTNVFGRGYLLKLAGEWSKEVWTTQVLAANPWLFDKPIMGRVDFHVSRGGYDEELQNVETFNEQRIGASSGLGFMLSQNYLHETFIETDLAFDDIRFSEKPKVKTNNSRAEESLLQAVLNRRFQPGGLLTLTNVIRQDYRNSSEHPCRGYQWSLVNRMGLGVGSNLLGFHKFELDASWYTPLVGEHDLVFGLHGHFGVAGEINGRNVPYRELFHVGGPTSVRGFLFGQIGPVIRTGTDTHQFASIGSKKAFYVNAELIFPFTGNLAVKGAFFYDGGAGWDTPGYHALTAAQQSLIQRNRFDYRHTVGFGIRMTQPQPIKIDWGFKLDRRPGEPHFEIHFSGYREF